mmetsp:Transcript_22957/g.47720  ORF Transcript_22957/g.47720 Transcript_22957/m.47720 type:complete len:118 (-) Transcript_22957:102-455(-)
MDRAQFSTTLQPSPSDSSWDTSSRALRKTNVDQPGKILRSQRSTGVLEGKGNAAWDDFNQQSMVFRPRGIQPANQSVFGSDCENCCMWHLSQKTQSSASSIGRRILQSKTYFSVITC